MYIVVIDHQDRKHANVPLVDKEHIEQLRVVVKTLHDSDCVHGDLRDSQTS